MQLAMRTRTGLFYMATPAASSHLCTRARIRRIPPRGPAAPGLPEFPSILTMGEGRSAPSMRLPRTASNGLLPWCWAAGPRHQRCSCMAAGPPPHLHQHLYRLIPHSQVSSQAYAPTPTERSPCRVGGCMQAGRTKRFEQHNPHVTEIKDQGRLKCGCRHVHAQSMVLHREKEALAEEWHQVRAKMVWRAEATGSHTEEEGQIPARFRLTSPRTLLFS